MAFFTGTTRSRAFAHWWGAIIGIITGVFYFGAGMQAFFVGQFKGWLDLVLWVAGVLAMLSLLPLGVVAVFRPRLAAYGVIASFAIQLTVEIGGSIFSSSKSYWSISGVVLPLLLFISLPCLIAGPLLYASGRNSIPLTAGPSEPRSSDANAWRLRSSAFRRRIAEFMDTVTSAGRRRHAQWAAIILGVLAGGWHFHWGVFVLSNTLHAGYWVVTLGVAATALTLLPLSVLAILRPRAAAYGALVSLAVALVFPLVLFHPPQFGVGEMLGSGLLFALLDLPLAAFAALLFYASRGPHSVAP